MPPLIRVLVPWQPWVGVGGVVVQISALPAPISCLNGPLVQEGEQTPENEWKWPWPYRRLWREMPTPLSLVKTAGQAIVAASLPLTG